MTLGEKLSPILVELENALWEHDFHVNAPCRFTDEGFKAATKIMMSVMMDKSWSLMERENHSQKDRENMATAIGNDFRAMVKKYTDIDTHDLYK